MVDIRCLVAKGYNTSEILKETGLSRRTFYRYLKAVFEHDRKVLENEHNTEAIMQQFVVLIDRYNTIYRHLENIATDTTIDAEYRRDCLAVMAEIARKIVIAYREGPQTPIVQKTKLEELKHKRNSTNTFYAYQQQQA